MINYILNCTTISLIIIFGFTFLARRERKKLFSTSKIVLVAEYKSVHHLIAVISAVTMFVMPLILSGILKEQDPGADRVVMGVYYVIIQYFTLAIFNRKVFLSEGFIYVSGLFGRIREIPNESFKRARITNIKMATRGYRFSNEHVKFDLDEKMQNFYEVEVELRRRAIS
jgi:hypothetical protein